MRRAGTVVGTAQGVLVLRCDDETHPDIGAGVLDEQLAPVGRVVDVFGPVDRPYLAVTPRSGVEVPRLLGSRLYVR